MSDEKSQQQTSTESTVAGAAKTGKAISNIAKGAAAGGAHGAAIEAGKSSAKWLIPLIAAVLLPLILVAMLPSIIFGSLLGDGTDTPNGISNDEVLVQNMTAINEGISSILSEGLTDVLERIDSDFALSGCDGKEINNPFGADVVFNANAFVSQYCAYKDTDVTSISKEDMEALLTANKDNLAKELEDEAEVRAVVPCHGIGALYYLGDGRTEIKPCPLAYLMSDGSLEPVEFADHYDIEECASEGGTGFVGFVPML